ncbi:MAG TPA: hypothetical protein VLM85_15660 [Polyangiaceae bacterium]|nr:hypothetical protein [Polyangiaceae bacterium]
MALSVVVLACGGRSSDAGDGGVVGPGATVRPGDSVGLGDIVGQVIVITAAENGFASDRFDVDLQPFQPDDAPCAGATTTVGSCCYFAPGPPPPLQPQGQGTPATEQSAGDIQLVDATTSSLLGTYAYHAGGYDGLPATFAAGTWGAGDDLVVSAAGDAIAAFTITAPALSPPTEILPSSIASGQDVVVAWAPASSSQTMSVSLLDSSTGAVVGCTVPEIRGTVTIDAGLFASFTSGTSCQAAAIRETDRYAQTSSGRVVLRSFGWASGFCTVH